MDIPELTWRADKVRTIDAQIEDLQAEQSALAYRNLEINDLLATLYAYRASARDAAIRAALGEPDPPPLPPAPVPPTQAERFGVSIL